MSNSAERAEGINYLEKEKVHELDILTESKISQACQHSKFSWNSSTEIVIVLI